MPVNVSVNLHFKLYSGFHTTGNRAELWADKALAEDWYQERTPIIPATSIKGWLRENAESFLRGFGINVCDASRPSTVCGECLVCQTFGAPRRKSPFRFSNGWLEKPLTDVRTGVSLSRSRKTAYEEQLFAMEVAWSPGCTVRVRGTFASDVEAMNAIALLWVAAKMGRALGAARSRGLGWLALEHFEALYNGELADDSGLMAIVESWRGEVRG